MVDRVEATHTDFDLYEQGCEGLVGECTGLYEQAMDPRCTSTSARSPTRTATRIS